MKIKIEFLYDNRKNKTSIFVWQGTRLIDKRELSGQTDKDHQNRIKKDIEKEYENE